MQQNSARPFLPQLSVYCSQGRWVATLATVMLLTPHIADALESCSAKLRRRDGVVVVGATSIDGQLSWASVEMTEPEPLAQERCSVTGNGAGAQCTLSDPDQVPPPPPPSNCVVRLSDESSECTAYVKGCVQGERRVIPCLQVSKDGKEVIYQGCNVHIRNDSGATATMDGTGNLIVGWNEETYGPRDRSGSHNIVVGDFHSWTSYGGIVGGFGNTISGEYASVVGGVGNIASGSSAVVLGGDNNEASGGGATVSGGTDGLASGPDAAVGGGAENSATGDGSFIGGGEVNTVSGTNAAAVGGSAGEAKGQASLVAGGISNLAVGTDSVVSGGEMNIAGDEGSTFAATVVGGRENTALNSHTTVLGGAENVASAFYATVSGGIGNISKGTYSTVSGGALRTASGEADWVAGSLFEDN